MNTGAKNSEREQGTKITSTKDRKTGSSLNEKQIHTFRDTASHRVSVVFVMRQGRSELEEGWDGIREESGARGGKGSRNGGRGENSHCRQDVQDDKTLILRGVSGRSAGAPMASVTSRATSSEGYTLSQKTRSDSA